MNFSHPDVQGALRDWWASLDDHRGERALLRRARSRKDLLQEDQHGRPLLSRFHDALRKTGFHRRHDGPQLAYVASILAHVKTDVPSMTFAQQMAASEDGVPPVKEQRFGRLLRVEEPERLHEQLMRVLRVLNGHVNLIDLATGVYEWHNVHRRNTHRRRWTRDYYAELLQGEKPELEVPSDHLPLWARGHSAIKGAEAEKAEVVRFNPAKLSEDWQRVQVAALVWWEQARAHYGGELAELRRCHTPAEVRLLKGFHRLLQYAARVGLLWNGMEGWKRENREARLAVAAGVLAHVRDHAAERPFAEQMATPSPQQKRARVSSLRFRRLLQIDDRRDLFRTLIRAIYHLGRTADVPSLAGGAYFWNERTRRRWAEGYYTTTPKDEA